jgi:hypothetical protein
MSWHVRFVPRTDIDVSSVPPVMCRAIGLHFITVELADDIN